MSTIQSVKPLLSAAADEIMKDVEKIIVGYEEEMFQSKREISRQRKMLDAPKPEIKLNTITERLPIEADEDAKMSKIEGLRVLVKHFLSVAADRIVEAVEKMIADYEGEMHQSKRDISRQCKILHVLLQPEIRLTRIPEEEQLNLSVWKEDFLTEQQQEWNSRPSLKNPESLQTERSHKDKAEEEEPIPSPGFSEPENGDDDDWNATQDGDSDRSEEWSNSGQHHTLTAKTPQTKKKQKSCRICGKSFQYEASLVKHLKSHPKDECGLCGMHFKTEEDFKLHVETHKTVKVGKVCDVCGKCFANTSILEVHMRRHTGERPYICEVCGKAFVSRHNMTQHLNTHTGERIFRCEVCGKSFSSQGHLTRHHMVHTGFKPYSCTTCSEHFISYSTLRKHRRTHLKYSKFTVTTPVFDDRKVNAEVEDTTATLMTKEQQIICKVCGKDFPSNVSLVKHLENHPKDDCGLCGMHFETEEDFELHLKTHIATVCEVCGKCFANKPFYLERHMMTHMGEKPFKCSQCGKAFRQRCTLTDHLRIHTGEKPYSCATCGKRFKTNSNLKQHMRVVKHFVSATP